MKKEFVNKIQSFKLIAPNIFTLNLTNEDKVNEITVINQSPGGANSVILSIGGPVDINATNLTVVYLETNQSFTINGKKNEMYTGKFSVYVNHSLFYSSGIEYGIFTVIQKQLL
jgi:hypothetical protein